MPAENIKMKTNPCLQVHNLEGKGKHEAIILIVICLNKDKTNANEHPEKSLS